MALADPVKDLPQVKLHWVAATVAGISVPRAALLLPVTRSDASLVGVMQVDTGAPRSIISSAARLQLLQEGLLRERTAPSQGTPPIGSSATLILHTSTGGRLEDVEVEIQDQVPEGILGVIGLDFMTHRRVVFDLADPSLTVASAEQALPGLDTLAKLPLKAVGDHVTVSLSIGGVLVDPALVDTGASAFGVSLFDESLWRQVQALGISQRCSLHIPAHQAAGQQITLTSGVVQGDLCMGDLCFPAGAVTVTSRVPVPGTKGLIGMAPFTDGKLVFDVPHMALYVSQPHASPPICR